MPERWQQELNKIDLLEPPPSLRERIGQGGDRRDVAMPARHRMATITISLLASVGAGLLLWSALPLRDRSLTTGGASDKPDVARIICTEAGTTVLTPEVRVQPDGEHFAVDNQAGMDEVVIVHTGPNVSADIDLSEATTHTFDALPPGDLQVGCFTDHQLEAPFRPEELLHLDGLVPLRFTDPEALYVSPWLDCGEAYSDFGPFFARQGDEFDSDEELIRSLVPGILPDDAIERAGYPGSATFQWAFRIVRDGQVVALIRLQRQMGDVQGVMLASSCDGSGIGVNG